LNFYKSLGVTPKINAATTYTVLGGSLMADEVVQAMQEASKNFVDMHDLQVKAGEKISKLTKNEAAYVTSGCAAGLVLAILALRTKGNIEQIGRLINQSLPPAEVIVQAGHRIPYDPALELAGAKIITVGDAIQTFPWQIEAAINEKTIGIFFVAGAHLAQPTLSLEVVMQIAKVHNLPVVVDAAAQLPPVENLWNFSVGQGADLVLFSGGKALRGPQASGLIVGKSKWIEAVRANGAPFQRYARALKVGKEEIAGLVVAVERFVNLDHLAEAKKYHAIVDFWLEQLGSDITGQIIKDNLNEAGQPVPRVKIKVQDALKLVQQLKDSNPSIEVVHNSRDAIWISPDCIQEGEAEIVSNTLKSLLKKN
jgi:L-seryl-tRNA(Ser) seleniumtransferase